MLPLALAITFHEAAHGFVAFRHGDPTAKEAGRLSFNPLRHIDAVGTVLLPAVLILIRSPIVLGYAKPVPVDFTRLNNPKRDQMLVAVAGPATNVILLLASALLLNLLIWIPFEQAQWFYLNLFYSLLINALLAVFNMLPIPPLDGSKVMAGLLPDSLAKPYMRLERYGILIVLGVLLLPSIVFALTGVKVLLLQYLILYPAMGLIECANILLVAVDLPEQLSLATQGGMG